jgi:CRP-like cAMP-binding protein
MALEQLRSVPLFAGLGEDVLAEVAAQVRPRHLDREEVLFRAGDPFRGFFVVCSGHVQLSRLASTGQEKVVELIGPKETFAEAVLFLDQPSYPVEARGLEPTELLEFPAEPFNRLLDERPHLTRNLLGTVSRRVHRLVQDVAALTLEDATGRVVGYLLARAEQAGQDGGEVSLPVKKAAVASRLGVQPETFSRVLSRLRQAGAIEVERDRIRLQDPEGLAQFLP